MSVRRGAERHRGDRLLPFTDAVVAIAMTLLVLPLVDIANEGIRAGELGGEQALFHALSDSIPSLIGFTISFFVIARLWWAHHSLFEHVERWTTGMVVANVLWLFTIALLPWATGLSATYRPAWPLSLIYVGLMTCSCALQTIIARMILRAEADPDLASRERFAGNLTTLVAFAIALVVCVIAPWTYYTPLALLSFTGLVDRRVHRVLTQRAPRAAG